MGSKDETGEAGVLGVDDVVGPALRVREGGREDGLQAIWESDDDAEDGGASSWSRDSRDGEGARGFSSSLGSTGRQGQESAG